MTSHSPIQLSRRRAGAAVTAAAIAVTDIARGTSAAAQGSTAMSSKPVSVRKAYADGPYGQIHYRYAGDRDSLQTPLMCLHASPLSSIVYSVWLGEMGKDRFAVAPDTPGYGSSDTPDDAKMIPDFADAMIAFMDNIGLESVDVMGYHTGSFTSADLAVRYPDRIRKVVMISAPIFDQAIIDDYSQRIYDPPPKFADVLETTANSIRENPMGMFTDLPSEDCYADIAIERLRHYRTGNWGFRAAFAYDLTAALPEIDQPLLILNPEDDLWELTPKAKPYLKNGRIHDLPGWTHGAMDKHTAEMAGLVRAFLAE
jgi:pimeloyl-ACP methyl ester carboxylesterase